MAESKRFLLRLDPQLFETIRRWAADDLRSINGQIEYLLTEQARRSGRLPRRRRPSDLADNAPEEGSGAGEVDTGEAEIPWLAEGELDAR